MGENIKAVELHFINNWVSWFSLMVISIYNHKGGTGKTSTTINLGRALSDMGLEVLLVDIDPQSNLTYSLGIGKEEAEQDSAKVNILITEEGFDLLPNNYRKTFESATLFHEGFELTEILDEVKAQYDFVLIDCPPAQSSDVQQALIASNGLIIPILLDPLSLEGLRQVLEGVNLLNEEYDADLKILGVLPSMVNSRRSLTLNALNFIDENYDVNIFRNHVVMDVRIAEAPSFGGSIQSYRSSGKSTKIFKNLARELVELMD